MNTAGVLGYVLEENVGFVLRQVTQRHLAIFSDMMVDELTPTQFSAIVRLYEHRSCSQNQLGRLAAMDGPTIKGVIDRLTRRGITTSAPDREDSRRLIVSLTEAGRRVAERAIPRARQITEATLAPLSLAQRAELLALLGALK